MFKTKYGNCLTEDIVLEYLDRLIGKVWKLLPLFETDKDIFKDNHKALMEEICGGEKLILYCGFYVELINKLEGMVDIDTHKHIKRHVRECIDIINKLKLKVGEWKIGENSG